MAKRVEEAVRAGHFPLVLAGNCGAALGVTAGLEGRIGTVWFDAHGDFNTPDTSPSGFLDGMGLATLTGQCWHSLANSIPGFRSIDSTRVVHVGGRDFGAAEEKALHASGVCVVPPGFSPRVFESSLISLLTHADQVYVHIDLDVLDKDEVGFANTYAVSGGLSLKELEDALAQIKRLLPIGAVTFASYDPSVDTNNQICQAAFKIINLLFSGD